MSTEQSSYSQFEKIWSSDKSEFSADDELKQFAWKMWQASRAALVVELPTEHELRQSVCSECASNALEMVENHLRAAGITVRDE